jgi:hypothetical protein
LGRLKEGEKAEGVDRRRTDVIFMLGVRREKAFEFGEGEGV